MPLTLNKLPIYEGVICVEAASSNGARWWYAGGRLCFSPTLVAEITQLRVGRLQTLRQDRLIARFPGHSVWFAVNVARSDVATLQKRSIWAAEFPVPPFDAIEYSAWPAFTQNRPQQASCVHLS